MKPVLNLGPYTVCFEAEAEDISIRRHFIKECGWTEAQFRPIKDYPFFSAKVSIWLDGEEIATDYLGACCYKTEEEFYKRYASDYFADMVRACVDEAKDPALTEAAAPWIEKMRETHDHLSKAAAA